MTEGTQRHLGLFGATSLGVGAIVGGGILALAGVAFATAGPGAIVAFALNGGIALLTAASFAALARRFPESGGVYAYARRLVSIEAAFGVGWVVWFASIVASVLYALGFAAFAAEGLARALPGLGITAAGADWTASAVFRVGLALAAIGGYAALLARRAGGGGDAETVGKVVVFVILILGGAWALLRGDPGAATARLSPFLPAGPLGVVQAMGYTFIALQGFDLIAAVGGEVRDPRRTIPLSMYLSLGIALAVYLPFLFLLATVGAPEEGVAAAAAANPEAFVAAAVERFLGPVGFWLVIGAAVLAMLSALRANLVGASRVAFAMARDRTLPRRLGRRLAGGSPAAAVGVTALLAAGIVVAVADVAAAGAASSLIFLLSFAVVHGAAILAGQRSGERGRIALPAAGALACIALVLYQGVAVPDAGVVVAWWLGIGGVLYLTLFAPGARMADASAEASDPDLARLRGRSPLVLVPIANPASAAGLVDFASTIRTPGTGRVLLLSVVRPPVPGAGAREALLRDTREILGEALERSLERSLVAETLFTIAGDPWPEIGRVAEEHGCETVLLGLPDLSGRDTEERLAGLFGAMEADAVVLRAPHRWNPAEVRSVLVPIGGRRDQSHLRARLLASLARDGARRFTYVHTVAADAPTGDRRRVERELRDLARDEMGGRAELLVEEAADPLAAITRRAADADLLVLGTQRRRAGEFGPGAFPLAVARATATPLALIRRSASRRFAPGPLRLP
ncbi:MAG: amino acid permease [Gemmatimonadota bacterium]|nr:amino acid permease [Gemmatimonadota bacterium]